MAEPEQWSDQFYGWCSAEFAHPNSPAGGTGPGFSRMPGPLQGAPFSRVPAVSSPAARLVDWRSELRKESEQGRRLAEEIPVTGKIPASLGLGSVLRIPVPGTKGLAIEFAARGWQPKGGSTSSLFIQDLVGKRLLRLDYGFNKKSGLVEWHWNQKGVADVFSISNHTTASSAGKILGEAAKYYKYAGEALLVVGVAMDVYSIVVSSKPLRRTIQVVSAWTASAGSCKVVGAGGAAIGTAITPGVGTAIGGVIGCAIGGFIGYITAEAAAGYLYDWAEETVFTRIEPSSLPDTTGWTGGGGRSGGGGASGRW